MTITFLNGYSTTSLDVIQNGDGVLIGEDGYLLPASGTAIEIAARNAEIVVEGTIMAGTYTAIATDSVSPDFLDATVRVTATGHVSGGNGIVLYGDNTRVVNEGTISADLLGVRISGHSNAVDNTGTIQTDTSYWAVDLVGDEGRLSNAGRIASARGDAVRIDGEDFLVQNSGEITAGRDAGANAIEVTSGAGRIVNDGLISAGGDAIQIVNSWTGGFELFNNGTIEGHNALRQVTPASSLSASIVNAGTMKGDILLGDGADHYDGQAGRLFGTLDLGGGNDLGLGGAGAETMMGGGGGDQLFGNEGADVLLGGDGDDVLDGGAGGDTIGGGDGNDEITLGDGADFVVGGTGADDMDGGGGIDTLAYLGSSAGVFVNLLSGQAWGGDAQGDVFQGFERLFGSSQGDTLTGSAGANTINGFLGNDVLKGGSGADQLRGGEGDDTLDGGAGRDVLFGNQGADSFRFRATSDSRPDPAQRDVIRDFAHGEDQIDLSLMDANTKLAGNQAFTWLDDGAFSGAAGQLHWLNQNGDTLIEADLNGDKVADFSLLLTGTVTLTADDFLL